MMLPLLFSAIVAGHGESALDHQLEDTVDVHQIDLEKDDGSEAGR